MEFEKIRKLMEDLDKSSLMDFELKMGKDFYLRMNKFSEVAKIDSSFKEESATQILCNTNKSDACIEDTKLEEVVIEKASKEGNILKASIVGTFYSSTAPSKPPFVKVGDKVKKGDTVCIIEAMKVMNEITSQYDGEIAEIFVENEDMVEFNQPLFRIV